MFIGKRQIWKDETQRETNRENRTQQTTNSIQTIPTIHFRMPVCSVCKLKDSTDKQVLACAAFLLRHSHITSSTNKELDVGNQCVARTLFETPDITKYTSSTAQFETRIAENCESNTVHNIPNSVKYDCNRYEMVVDHFQFGSKSQAKLVRVQIPVNGRLTSERS